LNALAKHGVSLVDIMLHVGIGTFQKIVNQDITKHHMEKEMYNIPQVSARHINNARKKGRRIIAVGTTVVRTLESAAETMGVVKPGKDWTNIFIYPGYRFKAIDGMITNFHLPMHSPFVMASAFIGLEKLKELYAEAIRKQYRFYSYGDAMLIL
jgi:S-adenosylmethionine:tRNA ribosyltransferase-isomerase